MAKLLSFTTLTAITVSISSVTATIAEDASVTIRRVALPRLSSRSSSSIPAAQHLVALGKIKSKRQNLLKYVQPHIASLAGAAYVGDYAANVTIGGQNFVLGMDTGSSDTWIPQVNYTCINLASEEEPESTCAFGTLYDPAKSKTYIDLPDLNFNITYGGGYFLLGNVANETVSVGGLTVKNQEIGVVNRAAWNVGDGVSSGLMGLAYPNLTSIFSGDESEAASDGRTPNNLRTYNPFFYSAVAEGLVNPYFSIAINRGTIEEEFEDPYVPNLGYLAFGGIAPVPVTDVSTMAPIEGYDISAVLTPTSSHDARRLFYTIAVDGFRFPGSEKLNTTYNNDTILDSGTTLNYVPTNVANAFAASVSPPAVWSDDVGAYAVECNATVPEFLVTIHGTTFSIDPKDQILANGPSSIDAQGNPLCSLGTNDGGPVEAGNLFVLRVAFKSHSESI